MKSRNPDISLSREETEEFLALVRDQEWIKYMRYKVLSGEELPFINDWHPYQRAMAALHIASGRAYSTKYPPPDHISIQKAAESCHVTKGELDGARDLENAGEHTTYEVLGGRAAFYNVARKKRDAAKKDRVRGDTRTETKSLIAQSRRTLTEALSLILDLPNPSGFAPSVPYRDELSTKVRDAANWLTEFNGEYRTKAVREKEYECDTDDNQANARETGTGVDESHSGDGYGVDRKQQA